MKKILRIFLALVLVFNLTALEGAAEGPGKSNQANIEIIEKSQADFKELQEKYRILQDENGRLRIEIRDLHGKLQGETAKRIPVLMYHHVIEQKDIDKYNWKNNTSVLSVEAFEEQMRYLYDNDFYVASLEELELFLDKKLDLPAKTVVITFDDGYLSNALYAYPILQKYNFRASIFMVGKTSSAPQADFEPGTTQSLNVAQTTKYTDVFDFNSHTYDLHQFDQGAKDPGLITGSEEAIKQDLLKNKALFNAKYLAYPYGRYNDRAIRLAQETGHRLGFTINKGYVDRASHKFILPRNGIGPKVGMDQFEKLVNLESVIR